mgnify:CR=1 FL=1
MGGPPHSIMPTLIPAPTRITAAGNKPKLIDEFVGRVNNSEPRLSVARMQSPSGWVEPGQTPEFDELLDERNVDFGDGYSRDAIEGFSADRKLQCMPYAV